METQFVSNSKPFQFTLRTMLIGTAGFALVMGLLIVPVVRTFEKRANRNQCVNNLRQIGVGLLQYEDNSGCFPLAYSVDSQGRRTHSWRASVAPFVESIPQFRAYKWDEPWDGPNNRLLHSTPMGFFSCPADPDPTPTKTSYLAVTGESTAWPGSKPARLTDFKHGTATSIMVVEVANSGIHWLEPKDLELRKLSPSVNGLTSPGISSAHQGGVNTLFADGSVRFLSNQVDPEIVKILLDLKAELPEESLTP
jgi:prepilin-type processing-associated H-X9-DG protein